MNKTFCQEIEFFQVCHLWRLFCIYLKQKHTFCTWLFDSGLSPTYHNLFNMPLIPKQFECVVDNLRPVDGVYNSIILVQLSNDGLPVLGFIIYTVKSPLLKVGYQPIRTGQLVIYSWKTLVIVTITIIKHCTHYNNNHLQYLHTL